MRLNLSWSRTGPECLPGLLPLSLLMTSLGCSALWDLSPDQCGSNQDCASQFGPRHVCNSGLCQLGNPSGQQEAADGGSRDEESCDRHRQCVDRHGEVEPHVCVEQRCVPLLTEECSLALPLAGDLWLEHLKTSDAILLGAFSPYPKEAKVGDFTRFFDLAVSELAQETGGLAAPNGKRRAVVMVVCEGGSPDREALAREGEHLTETLQVPGIVSTLQSDDLQYIANEFALEQGTFILSGLEADSVVYGMVDGGLIWTMLGSAEQVAQPMQALFDLTVSHLQGNGSLTEGRPPRVALLAPNGSPRLLEDFGDYIKNNLSFNGEEIASRGPNFLALDIVTVYGDPAAASKQLEVAERLLEFQPDIVLAMAAEEFLEGVLPLIEDKWQEGWGAPPFYLLSPYHANTLLLANATQAPGEVSQRMLGLAYAGPKDRTLYEKYLLRLESRYPELLRDNSHEARENFYDAPYFLLYATAAASGFTTRLSGSDLTQGMLRLLEGPVYEMGRSDMPNALALLQSNPGATISLKGTLGMPNFEVRSGARADSGSVFCVQPNGEVYPDVLRWDPGSEKLVEESPVRDLCIPGF